MPGWQDWMCQLQFGGLWLSSGCRWSGPYFCWTAPKSVSLEELVGHGTLSRHPKEGRLHHSTSDGLNLDWVGGWKCCIFVLQSNDKYLDGTCLLLFYPNMQKLAGCCGAWPTQSTFWFPHQTVNFYKLLTVLVLSDDLQLKMCQLCLFKNGTEDTSW